MSSFFTKALAAASDAYEYSASTVSSVSSTVTAQVWRTGDPEATPTGGTTPSKGPGGSTTAGTGTKPSQAKPGGGGTGAAEKKDEKADGAAEEIKKNDDENYGKLEFSLDYNFDKGILNVTVIQAVDLPAMDIGGTSDPYCRVFLLPDKKKRFETKKHKKTLNPVFNETFSFPKVPFNEVSSKTLICAMFDHDAVGADDQMGEVILPLATIDLASENLQMWKEIKEPPKNVLGDICFSLRYVPKKSQLTCIIIECKQLKAMDVLTGASDPYVKLNLMQNNKRVKKVKTGIKMKDINPYYNQSFKFEVKPYEINKTELHLYVMDYDRVGSNDAIGWLKLGMNAEGTAGRHWRDMVQGQGRSIAQWHTLLPVEDD